MRLQSQRLLLSSPEAREPITTAEARRALAVLTEQLTAARKAIDGMSQAGLARAVGVSENSVQCWEAESTSLTGCHLLGWARAVRLRLVLVDAFGSRLWRPLDRDDGESWERHEVRRLVAELVDLRTGYPPLSQAEVERRAGVSRSCLKNWENLAPPPRALGLVSWAMALRCSLRLDPAQADV